MSLQPLEWTLQWTGGKGEGREEETDRQRAGCVYTKIIQFYLSNLFDLSSTFPDERAALRALDDQTK